MLAVGCSDQPVINTGEPQHDTATAAPPAAPSPPLSNAHLVNAFDYVVQVGEATGYYFTTPSGKWRCAILTRTKAGREASRRWRTRPGVEGQRGARTAASTGLPGAPRSPDPD